MRWTIALPKQIENRMASRGIIEEKAKGRPRRGAHVWSVGAVILTRPSRSATPGSRRRRVPRAAVQPGPLRGGAVARHRRLGRAGRPSVPSQRVNALSEMAVAARQAARRGGRARLPLLVLGTRRPNGPTIRPASSRRRWRKSWVTRTEVLAPRVGPVRAPPPDERLGGLPRQLAWTGLPAAPATLAVTGWSPCHVRWGQLIPLRR